MPVRLTRQYEKPPQFEAEEVRVCVTSDFFHQRADNWRQRVWEVIGKYPEKVFFILTKRPERISKQLPRNWEELRERVRIGVSIENQFTANLRIKELARVDCIGRCVLAMPLIDKIELPPEVKQFEKIIIGGEHGINPRILKFDWVVELYKQAKSAEVDILFKNTGAMLQKGNRVFDIPQQIRESQAKKAHKELRSEIYGL